MNESNPVSRCVIVDASVPESAEHAARNWAVVLAGMKKLLEQRPAGECG